MTATYLRYEFLRLWRNKRFAFFSLFFPIVLFLIFGVAAASAASSGVAPFLTPFLAVCALSLAAIALAPFAAAAALRQVRE